ncbi:MAG: RNA polymerase factor sigma-54 [Chitinophagaceae bacterium]|jgi:RNA polymerase sigma-54 factor|nr:RNA polymerase factor sigma-54 [Chitinophagaceae bacterium]MCE2974527.1 RNA polymerase factor sigma-54 [Sediminibacterium sp.]MCA6476782.1 RNA polymerase factor sigma-54 [Chitinophagaceae bacterium]MCA6483157.1 RNA polymerase factor sigma-54 [Chitinophagaceae bacterium]MCA6484263.1 RNA polymerase factor sigma-54 [Chitinophagaceae bacterium]
MALSQSFQQKLLQKLSPQQIQLMKLLQVPTANLEERIKEEIEENPALEMDAEAESDEYDINSEDQQDSEDRSDDEFESEEQDAPDINEYLLDDDGEIADYKTKDDHYPEMGDDKVIPIRAEVSFQEHLMNQLGLLELDQRNTTIAEQIIGSLDDDGYLRSDISSLVDDMAFRQGLEVAEKEVTDLLLQIQQFDPPGIAARSLQECLLLQLKRKESEGESVKQAIQILSKYFDEFTKKHYDRIQRSMGITDVQLKDIIGQIIRLNPKPGGNFSSGSQVENFIIPDFYVINNNGKLELTLNARNAPALRVSEGYRDMMKEYEKGSKKDKRQKEAVTFIRQKIDAARWFIDMIQQRQATLLNTMGAILQHQQAFFLSGDETTLRPMILKDIAEITGLDISTVSRVANSKFVQTEFGNFRLKYFFSESLSTDSGEEVSTKEVKKILLDFVEAEDKRKPLSDDLLTEMLQGKGYNIARRTVAKYREQLNIPVARLRKEL